MEKLVLESSPYTPFVAFDACTGVMEIKGRAIPEQADQFWMPIISWFDNYVCEPANQTVFKIDLEYFNIASSKRILFLLYKLIDLAAKTPDVKVQWYYREDDLDMFEVGNDYAYLVKLNFEFIKYSEHELV